MKLIKRVFKPYGLRARFALSLCVFIALCGLLFFLLYSEANIFLTNYFERSDFMGSHIRKQGRSLQEYIDENGISSSDLSKLDEWEHKQPVILLEMYSDGKCIYSSFHNAPSNQINYNKAADDGSNHAIALKLTDKEVSAILYSDFTYQYYVMATALSAIASLVLFCLLFLRSNRRLIQYVCRLNEEVQILEGGNLEYQVSVEGNDEITDLAKSMNRMRESFRQQMQTEQSLHEANKRLVTEMSHDLRTPLTSIMLYLEILRSHRYSSESELQDYLDKIDAKACHMKELSDHLFEYAMEESASNSAERQSMKEAFGRAVDGLIDDLTAHGFSVVTEVDWKPYLVDVNAEYVRRIFENIVSNAVKYAEPSAEITIQTIHSEQFCGFSVINTCSLSSSQAESRGIGIENIRTLMKQMGGICTVEQTETAFEIVILFPRLLSAKRQEC